MQSCDILSTKGAAMATKDKLLELLENKRDEYVSGEEISKNLGLSRTAVWKAINQLKEGLKGYGHGIYDKF